MLVLFASTIKRLWQLDDRVRFQDIQFGHLRHVLSFPLVMLLFASLTQSLTPGYTLFGFDGVTLALLSYSVGSVFTIVFSFSSDTGLATTCRTALFGAGIAFVLAVTLPSQSAQTIALCVCMACVGATSICYLYSFSMTLNNAERFSGALFFSLAESLISSLRGMGIPVLQSVAAISAVLFIGLFICAFPISVEKFIARKSEAAPKKRMNYWYLVYAFSINVLLMLSSEYLSSKGSLVKTEFVFAGIIAVLIAVFIQVTCRKSMWHMWNICLLLALVAVVLIGFSGGAAEQGGEFMLSLVKSFSFIPYFCMIAAMFEHAGNYAYFKKYILLFFAGLVAALLVGGTLIRVFPQQSLFILTMWIAASILAIFLLSPMLSQKLFVSRWIEGLQGLLTNDASPEDSESDNVVESIFEDFLRDIKTLTPTERRVFDCYIDGSSIDETINRMYISKNTLKHHNSSLYAKLGVSSKSELDVYIKLLRDNGYIDRLKNDDSFSE